MKKLINAFEQAKDKINQWLEPYGYSVKCEITDFGKDQLGEYESGTVFSKEIEIKVNPTAIKRACQNDPCKDKYSDPCNQVKITVYHEVGHAILEQLIDWAINIHELIDTEDDDKVNTDPYGEKFWQNFFEVFDDKVKEETVVEDFAWGFFNEKPSHLQICWDELNKKWQSAK